MSLGYQLLVALLLLLPGIAGWVAFRAGATDDLLSPYPDRHGSTTTLAAILIFAGVGHLLAAVLLKLNGIIARRWPLLPTDLDFYRPLQAVRRHMNRCPMLGGAQAGQNDRVWVQTDTSAL